MKKFWLFISTFLMFFLIGVPTYQGAEVNMVGQYGIVKIDGVEYQDPAFEGTRIVTDTVVYGSPYTHFFTSRINSFSFGPRVDGNMWEQTYVPGEAPVWDYGIQITRLNHPSGYNPATFDRTTDTEYNGGPGPSYTMMSLGDGDLLKNRLNGDIENINKVEAYKMNSSIDSRSEIRITDSSNVPVDREGILKWRSPGNPPSEMYYLRELTNAAGARLRYDGGGTNMGHATVFLTERPKFNTLTANGEEGTVEVEAGESVDFEMTGEEYAYDDSGGFFNVKSISGPSSSLVGESYADSVGEVPGRNGTASEIEFKKTVTFSNEGVYEFEVEMRDAVMREAHNGTKTITVQVGDGEPVDPCEVNPNDASCVDDSDIPDTNSSVSCDVPTERGTVTFSADNTDGSVRNWSQENVDVEVTLDLEQEYDVECTVSEEWTYDEYEDYQSDPGHSQRDGYCRRDKNDDPDTDYDESQDCADWVPERDYEAPTYKWERDTTGNTESWEWTYTSKWELGDDAIHVTSEDEKGYIDIDDRIDDGTVITLQDETYQLKISGETSRSDWEHDGFSGDSMSSNEPSGCVDTAPSGETSRGSSECVWTSKDTTDKVKGGKPNVTWDGESGYYNIDLEGIDPVSVSPTSRNWTNRMFYIRTELNENFSGIYGNGSTYSLSNNAREYGGGTFSGKYDDGGPTEELQDIVSIPVGSDGIFNLRVQSEDYAGYEEGPSTYGTYKFDGTSPYEAQFGQEDGKCEYRNIPGIGQGFDCVADASNELSVTVGDNLSGVASAEFAWSKSKDSATEGGWGWNNLPAGTSENQPHSGVGSDRDRVEVSVHSKTDNDNPVTEYNELKEGLWYLHIKQTDRAGNTQTTVSDPVFVNKIKNLRIVEVKDPTWEDVFYYPNGSKKEARVQGVFPEWMPMYSNFENKPIKLGYKVVYRFDVVGFDGGGDFVDVDFDYHAMTQANRLHKNVDVYVEGNDRGDFVPLLDSRYASMASGYSVNDLGSGSYRYENGIDRNKDGNVYNDGHNFYSETREPGAYHTVEREIYLPPTTKFVRKGDDLDIVNGNDFDYRLIVSNLIGGYRSGVGSLNYTDMEDKWAEFNNFGQPMNDLFGKNRPTYMNLNGYGGSQGSFFWYQLDRTALDDIDSGRPY